MLVDAPLAFTPDLGELSRVAVFERARRSVEDRRRKAGGS
jgi:hypothetical protein